MGVVRDVVPDNRSRDSRQGPLPPTRPDPDPCPQCGDGSLPQLDAHLRRIAEDGYTILPDAIEPELVDEIDEALLALERELGPPPPTTSSRVRTRRASTTSSSTAQTFQKIPVHPHVLPVVEGVLDPGCSSPRCPPSPSGPTSRPSRSTPTTS